MQHSLASATTTNGVHSSEALDVVCQQELDDLLDEITLGVCFDNHRAAKLGYLFLDEGNDDDRSHTAVVSQRGFDVFGEAINSGSNGQVKKQLECVCPHCSRSLAAQRFAPHLEKCMGMGRNSSRIASKRIASATGKANGQDSDDLGDDQDNSGDTDWNYNNDSKKRKKKDKSNGLVKKATRKDASLKNNLSRVPT